jgi:hypothetical protein
MTEPTHSRSFIQTLIDLDIGSSVVLSFTALRANMYLFQTALLSSMHITKPGCLPLHEFQFDFFFNSKVPLYDSLLYIIGYCNICHRRSYYIEYLKYIKKICVVCCLRSSY